MRNLQKQDKESGKVQLSLLVAVVLACGSAGVWSELRAASPSTIVSRSMSAYSPDFSTAGQLSENGDGTAFELVFAMVTDTQALGTIWPSAPNNTYTISTQFKPGQSGNSSASATGQFTIETYTFDVNTFETFGPYVFTVDLGVANATQVGAFIQQGVTATTDPQTGQTSIVRQHIIGEQATGGTAGSVTVSLGGNVVAQLAGGFGMAQENTTHTLQRIH